MVLVPGGNSILISTALQHILQGISGQVKPGEMVSPRTLHRALSGSGSGSDSCIKLLVLGRPGSGCTSLLKIISNLRDEFYKVSGDVRYGNIGSKEAQQFRSHIAMNTEGEHDIDLIQDAFTELDLCR